ncbi:protein KTI13 [Trichomonascus vanleenenianus]|uniref:Ats1p n=1 Tax=Trichomonascus vanleenenianus TaxID=2268995 RepID=UPI003ECB1B8D
MIVGFGSNGNCQLGLDHDEDLDVPTKSFEGVESRGGAVIAGGGNHTVVIGSDHKVSAKGLNDSGQTSVTGDLRCSTAAAGWEYTILVSQDGKHVYSLGNGPKGELGLGDVKLVSEPQQIPNFPPDGRAVKKIAASMSHVVVLLDNGSVWGWGVGRKGQLGEPADKVVSTPRKVPIDLNGKVTHIACGREYTLVGCSITGDIRVLGNPRFGIDEVPKLDGFKDLQSGWSTAHVLLNDGRVLSWGNNSHGQHVPAELAKYKVASIGVGTEHVLALEESGTRVFAWGWGEHGNCGPNYTDGELNVVYESSSPVKGVYGGYATSWIVV